MGLPTWRICFNQQRTKNFRKTAILNVDMTQGVIQMFGITTSQFGKLVHRTTSAELLE